MRTVTTAYQHRIIVPDVVVEAEPSSEPLDVEKALGELLLQDLAFAGAKTNYATHALHAFAAKFPPQLPRMFIQTLTRPGDFVLDPMAGSGTTLVEALLAQRQAVGVDLDPLAILLCQVKTTPLDVARCIAAAGAVDGIARESLGALTDQELSQRFTAEAIKFFEFWFDPQTIRELAVLIQAIDGVADPPIHALFQVAFSSIIITKSGGVSRARDLAHSRPHRDPRKLTNRSALDVFAERLHAVLRSLESLAGVRLPCRRGSRRRARPAPGQRLGGSHRHIATLCSQCY